MDMLYSHRQFSLLTVVSFLAMTAALSALFILIRRAPAEHSLFVLAVVAAVLLVGLAHLVFLYLTVDVSDRELRWYFGPGFWKKRILRSDITAIKRIRLPWWYGIGIKSTLRGWVYLVSPGEGVEIMVHNGSAVCIGTDDADGLIAALAQRAVN